MSQVAEIGSATQTYTVYVNAKPEQVWDAITKPEWTQRYGYGGTVAYDLRPGGAYGAYASEEMREHGAPEVVVEGEVLEAEPPRRLAQTWRMLFDEELASEPFTRLTWQIDQDDEGFTRVSLTHEVDGAPRHAAIVSGSVPDAGGGWPFVLSDLKTLLETGKSLRG